MSNDVKVLVLRTAGTNCDQETAFAFASFGAEVELVHVNQLVKGEKRLADVHILAIPGGFTYGDDITSGRILGNELRLKLGEDLRQFIAQKKLIIGICNGFQILVKSGILPGPNGDKDTITFEQTATLTNNDSAKFEDRWIHLNVSGKSVWTQGLKDIVYFPVAHAEGKFIPGDAALLKRLSENGQIAFSYCQKDGSQPGYPQNPNGSVAHIAGITDVTGRVLGLMPHPERHFFAAHHPAWQGRRGQSSFGDGARIFQNGVDYVRKQILA